MCFEEVSKEMDSGCTEYVYNLSLIVRRLSDFASNLGVVAASEIVNVVREPRYHIL